jgi:hypothetical protein
VSTLYGKEGGGHLKPMLTPPVITGLSVASVRGLALASLSSARARSKCIVVASSTNAIRAWYRSAS